MFFLDESNENFYAENENSVFLENEEMEEIVFESVDTDLDGIEGALIAVSECDEMWYNLREKMIKLEHVAIITEDADLLQEGKTSFGENLKNMFRRMMDAIEGMFRNFMDWITRSIGTDKAIVKRFKDNNSTFTIKGYKFTGLKELQPLLFGKLANEYLDVHLEGKHSEESIISTMCKKFGMKERYSSRSEFTKGFKEFLLGSAEKKEFSMSTQECIKVLESAKGEIEYVRTSKNHLQKGLNNLIKAMDSSKIKGTATEVKSKGGARQFEPTYKEKQGDEWKDHNKKGGQGAESVKSTRTAATLLMTAYGQYISALKLQRSQARACVGKATTFKTEVTDKETGKTEKVHAEVVDKDGNPLKESSEFVGILGSF